VALVDAATECTYTAGELDRLIGRFAAGLAASGFRPGDTLLMFAPNSIEWPIVALGAMAAGGVVSGVNPSYGAAELAHQMRDAGARFAFTSLPLLATLREAAAQAACEPVIVLAGNEGACNVASLIECRDPEPNLALDPDMPAALPYSSGTTGVAKGVLLTHRTLVSNVCQTIEALRMTQDDVTLAVLPMFHIAGFTCTMLSRLAAGGSLVTMPRFEPEFFLKSIARYRVSHLPLVPPLMLFLAKHPLVDAYDLSSLRQIGCGAAPLGAQLEQNVVERLACKVGQGYGMTELSGLATVSYPDRARAGSSGQLCPGTQARVVDPETLSDLARDVSGELWFRGPQTFKGYLNLPEASAATLDAEGWVHTGDIGYFDAEGYLFVTDRLKELIKVKAFQVAPAELEALLLTHPAVADVAVIGRPDERAGEIPVAYVVGRGAVDAEAIKAWVAERVTEYKRLGDVVTVEAIPKSPSGKILRRIVRTLDAKRSTAAT
jgi:acyl-CoA synthetase (AMP-forming)/AMP-acid ligase II